jgi:hypothetical protein
MEPDREYPSSSHPSMVDQVGHVPGQPHSDDDGFAGAAPQPIRTPKRSHRRLVIGAVILVVLAVGIPVGVHYLAPDSGVAECKRYAALLAANEGTFPGPMTRPVTGLRAAFADSRYDDLRVAGTTYDEIVRASAAGEPLPLGQGMATGYLKLEYACKHHGAPLPDVIDVT